MEWFLVCLIIISCLMVSRVFFGHRITTVEVFTQFFIPFLIVSVLFFYLRYNLTKDYEIWNNYIVEAVYEEAWNEYVHQTCEKQISCGTDSDGNTKYCTKEYDCSYVRHHPERWFAYLNDTRYVSIKEPRYKKLVSIFGNQQKIGVNSGYTISGNIYNTQFDNIYDHIQPYSSRHSYQNKIQVSNSVMGFDKISSKQAKEMGLYEFDSHDNLHFDANHVIGWERSQELEKLNAYYGMLYQINIIVLVYHDKPMSIFQKQKSYWHGGNKNELVLGFGVSDGKVVWADNFSWSESHDFLVELKKEQEKQIKEKLDIDIVAKWLYDEIPNRWKRRKFKEFDYLTVETPLKYKVAIVVICLLSSLIVSAVCIFNDVDASYQEVKLPEFINYLKWNKND